MPELDDKQLAQRLQRWVDGKGTLKDVRGYTDEELYSIARTGYFFFYQGRIDEARTLFQGLYAVNPVDPYFAKALGVVEMAAGNAQGALAAYDVAIKIAPNDPHAYVGRAEVKIAMGQKSGAVDDLRRAAQFPSLEEELKAKISAMLQGMSRK